MPGARFARVRPAIRSHGDPAEFTHPIAFRRCRRRNIVKDDHYVCAVCGGTLPNAWNMDETHAR
ncbi:hypothetical protein GWI34_23090 [Actinomadura sp. DSM 109109]|nr:hypothetical protein [Actinomadura lepetitiana]